MIAEDSGLFRTMLTDLFKRHELDVIGEAGAKDQVLDLIKLTPPDVVVLDIRLPPNYTDEGLQVAEALRDTHPQVGVLMLSQYAETSYAVRLLHDATAGVGYLVKDRVQDTVGLIDALHRVHRGETVIDPEVVQRLMLRRRTADPLDHLTGAEREVLKLVAEGWSNTAIARQTCSATKTVEKRVTSIARKLGLPPPDNNERADVNVRVLAVLRYLRGDASDG